MTNGEKIEEIFPNLEISPDPYSPSVDICVGGIMMMRVDRNWWDAEYKEPTTKNDLGVDCIDRNKAYEIIESWAETFDVGTYFDNEQVKEIIMACANRIDEFPSVTPQLTSGLEKNSKKLEKDFGEFDCISRADAIKAMQEKAKKLTNEDTINGLCGAVAILFDLPSVTPQEPKTGRWIGHGEYCENLGVMPSGLGAYEWCSNCDCGIDVREWHRNHYNYCPNCGAKMVEET